jgi:folylpolyglutamate synthase
MKRQQKHDEANFNLRDTEKYLERIEGFNLKQLDKLSVIHVSGSKGKGSVCTYTDAILREYNVKTGLFTSPHLMSVTERIKLMGSSISKNLFNRYFWEVYDAIQAKKSDDNDLPSYFKFLQVMAFYIFVKENVDVAIIEVGIGGQYDSTNIIRNTEVVGITALQLEHTQLLGNTLEEIAWQKAGIIKKNAYVYAMNQPCMCSKVIKDRFEEIGGKRLSFLPPFGDYSFNDCHIPDFSQTSEVDRLNFSLASQLSARWLRNRHRLSEEHFSDNVLRSIDKKFVDAYEKCHFDGRFQRIEDESMTYFLDGAHTIDSMKICSEWFAKQVVNGNQEQLNVLVFNVTGDRDSELILQQLHSIKFDLVCFSTNIPDDESHCEQSGKSDIIAPM